MGIPGRRWAPLLPGFRIFGAKSLIEPCRSPNNRPRGLRRSGLLGRGKLGLEPLKKVGATSQPLGFPAPAARVASHERERDRPCTQVG